MGIAGEVPVASRWAPSSSAFHLLNVLSKASSFHRVKSHKVLERLKISLDRSNRSPFSPLCKQLRLS